MDPGVDLRDLGGVFSSGVLNMLAMPEKLASPAPETRFPVCKVKGYQC